MLMDAAYANPTVATNVIFDDGDGNPDGDGAYHKSAGLNPHDAIHKSTTTSPITKIRVVKGATRCAPTFIFFLLTG